MIAFHPFRHFWLKLLAIGLAILLWFTIVGDPIVERGLRIPLELQNLAEQFAIVDDLPSTVDVRVRGSSGVLSRLETGEVLAVVDMTGLGAGRRLVNVTPDHVRAPYGIQVVDVQPSTIPVVLQPSGHKAVPIVPALEGEPAAGYLVTAVSAEPETVEVFGPMSRLERLAEAITESISVAGATRTVQQEVTVGVEDTTLRLGSVHRALVTVQVEAAAAARALEEVSIEVRNLGAGLEARVQPDAIVVYVRGHRRVLTNLGSDAVAAFVDAGSLESGHHRLRIEVSTPEELEVVRVEPGFAAVVIQ